MLPLTADDPILEIPASELELVFEGDNGFFQPGCLSCGRGRPPQGKRVLKVDRQGIRQPEGHRITHREAYADFCLPQTTLSKAQGGSEEQGGRKDCTGLLQDPSTSYSDH